MVHVGGPIPVVGYGEALLFRTGVRGVFFSGARFFHTGNVATAEQVVFGKIWWRAFRQYFVQLWHPLRCRVTEHAETVAPLCETEALYDGIYSGVPAYRTWMFWSWSYSGVYPGTSRVYTLLLINWYGRSFGAVTSLFFMTGSLRSQVPYSRCFLLSRNRSGWRQCSVSIVCT